MDPPEGSGKDDHPSEKSVAEDFDFDKVVERVSRAIPRGYNGDSGETMPSIYVVPMDLAEGRKDAYEPAAVCIGLLYDGAEREKEAFHKLERYKWCCVRKLIVNAAGAWIPEVHAPLLGKCLDRMRDLEPQIRTSYGVSISMDAIGGGDRLALMMLLDGCFVLHRLLKYARLDRRRYDEEDDDDWTQVIGRYGVWGIATRDLLLLKNQIPFFVLVELFQYLKSRARDHEGVLIDGALRLFAPLRPGPGSGPSTIACRDVRHLLHLFYLSIGLSPLPESSNSSRPHDELLQLGWVPCAKELEEAGVRFRAREKTKTFLDVSFHGGICGGVLEIPPLQLYDSSEALFRNLIAFEQTYLDTPGHVTAYAIFMDCLIKTPEDMRLLHQSGVLVSHMNGDRDDDTGFFSRVCAQAHTSPDRNYLNAVMGDVLRYQNRRWPRWRSLLVRNYFSNPWVTISLVAAAFLLLMTVLQTFFSVYGYFKPPATK
jgi:hypothetical protein